MIQTSIPAVPTKDALLKGAWQHKEEWEHYASLFHCTVVPMNDIALSLLKDAHEELKKSKRYKAPCKVCGDSWANKQLYVMQQKIDSLEIIK